MDYKQLIANAIERQQVITDTARAAGREMTAQESSEFDELQRSIDGWKAAMDAQEGESRAQAAERSRCEEISALCRDFGRDAAGYISSGRSVAEVQTEILSELRKNAAAGQVRVQETGEDAFRSDMADALLMRTGTTPASASAEARKMRGMSLRDMAVECLSRDGENAGTLLRKSSDELYADLCRSYNPTAAFPAILDATINKSLVEVYAKTPTTFEKFTVEGTLSDFKANADHQYIMGGGDFYEVPENGELKASSPRTELLPQRQLKTYGTQFSMTRQAFINDDIGFITEVPAQYASQALRKINKQVYEILYNNPTVYDGKALFCKDHGNLIDGGSKPTVEAAQAALLKLMLQEDPFGDSISITPRSLITPIGWLFEVYQLLNADKLPGSANNDLNPIKPYGIVGVEDAALNKLAGTGACPWFLAADTSSVRGIRVDYLNGQKTPTVRRMEAPGTLGFVWDIYMDWGITVTDYRAFVKNPGVAL